MVVRKSEEKVYTEEEQKYIEKFIHILRSDAEEDVKLTVKYVIDMYERSIERCKRYKILFLK